MLQDIQNASYNYRRKITMKDKIINFFKNKNTFILISILISFIIAFIGIQKNFIPKHYKDYNLKSDIVKTREKYIDENNNQSGVFTYGPYINLEKGNYSIIISYECNYPNIAEITCDFGEKILENTILEPESNLKIININVNKKIDDKSAEIRTIYNSMGYFKVNEITVKYNDFILNDFVIAALFIILMLIIVFIFKDKFNCIYTVAAYTTANIIFMYSKFTKNIVVLIIFFIISIIAIFCIKNFSNILEPKFKTIKNYEEIIVILLSSYLISSITAAILNEIDLNVIDFVKNVSFEQILFNLAVSFNIIFILRVLIFDQKFTHITMFISAVIFGIIILEESQKNVYLTTGITAIIGYIAYYISKNEQLQLSKINISYNKSFILTTIITVITAIYFGMMTIYRHKTFSSSTYDFGIFAQMYEYLARTGMPLTTCERNKLLSHFYIHFSPIYYTILPIYMIFRKPEALLMMQSFIVFSGSIPAFLICRKYKLPPIITLFVSLIYLAYPGFLCPLYYDFHENKFLPLMIMWTIYFIENKKYKISYIFIVLTLMIKEDAALYVIFLSLYFIFSKKEYKNGLLMLFGGFIYFGVVISVIQHFGMGLMEGHYSIYYLTGQSGVFPMAKNIILNCGFFINNLFTESTFEFIFYMLGSLIFIPMVNKNTKNLLLLIPFVAINLMTNYPYQHDVGYQYCYGSGALIFYLFIINISQLDNKWKNTICLTAFVACMLFVYTKRDDLQYYQRVYAQNKENIEKTEAALTAIPEKVSITSSTYILPHLYNKEKLYMFPYDNDTDYYVLQPNAIDNYSEHIQKIIDKGYINIYEDNIIEIYKTKQAPDMNEILEE